MALVSPGVQVTVTDESFFIPASAPTVPLLFVATAAEKTQGDGVTPAPATFENNVIRTVTSLTQSTELYGIPLFLEDDAGNQLHGDSRNEYGLFALNQYLGVGNRAFVVRADVNLDDDLDNLRTIWNSKQTEAAVLLDNLVTEFLNEYNQVNGFISSNAGFRVTVDEDEFIALATTATVPVFEFYSFQNSQENFFDDNSIPAAATAGFQVANFDGRIRRAQQKVDLFESTNSASRLINVAGAASSAGSPNVGTDSTNLGVGTLGSPSTDLFQVRVQIDGGAVVEITMLGSTILTYEGLVIALNEGPGGSPKQAGLFAAGAFAQIVDGNVRIVSLSTDDDSAIAILNGDRIVPGGSPAGSANQYNLLSSSEGLTDFVSVEATTTGGSNPTTVPNVNDVFNVTVTLDGGSAQLLSVQGKDVQNFDQLITALNTQLVGGVVELDVDGNILFSSAGSGSPLTSAIAVVDGSFPVDLIGRLYAGASGSGSPTVVDPLSPTIDSATVGETNPTGLADDSTLYTASVTVDGVPKVVDIVGSAAQTFADLLTEINADLAPLVDAAETKIDDDGNIVVTSVTTGASSTVVITDVDLFSSLPWFVSLDVPVAGLDGDTALDVFANGYDVAATGTYDGLEGIASAWVTNSLGSLVPGEWTAAEASGTLLAAADDYQFTQEFLNETSLGANDSARRVAIVTALQASINSNTEIRSPAFEYNLILCPGYDETVDEMLALSVDIGDEAMVIADTPVAQTPSETVAWAATSSRQQSQSVAYYYPWGLASNLDGTNVVVAASGIALRTITFSDNVSEIWFAPAGTRRGLVSGVTQVGYVNCGVAGCSSPSEFIETNLNLGQRDDLYKYFTNINPIVFFPGRGLLVWGQKTSSNAASARDRVNVERLIEFVRRQLRKSLLPFVFEPNDALTRDSVKALVDNFLGDLIVRRGLLDFATVCDESNNTPVRIDRNELYIDVALKPVKAAEFIFVPIRIVATGTEI